MRFIMYVRWPSLEMDTFSTEEDPLPVCDSAFPEDFDRCNSRVYVRSTLCTWLFVMIMSYSSSQYIGKRQLIL
jgi:hypothetical protein